MERSRRSISNAQGGSRVRSKSCSDKDRFSTNRRSSNRSRSSTRKSVTDKEDTNGSPMKEENTDTSTPSTPGRLTRSQNPAFVAKQKSFLQKVSGGNVPSPMKVQHEDEQKNEDVTVSRTPLKRKREKDESSDNGSEDEEVVKPKAAKISSPSHVRPDKDKYCWTCHKEGIVLSCHTCPRSFHLRCAQMDSVPSIAWMCRECATIMHAENVDTRSTAMKQLTLDRFCSLLKFALNRLKSLTGSEPFWRPVDQKEFSRYREFVIYPMDFSQLEYNIRRKAYGSTEAFIADVKWIVHDCIVFNTQHTKLTSSAKYILKVCKQEMLEIEICPDCYYNANTMKDSWFIEPCRRPHVLVWAKLKGYPFWPGKVLRVNDDNADVRFFGAHDRAWVHVQFCYLYSKEMPAPVKSRKLELQFCIKELEQHARKLKERFGRFELPPSMTPFDPNKDQIHLFLPTYKEEAFRMRRYRPKSRTFSEEENDNVVNESDPLAFKNENQKFSNCGKSPKPRRSKTPIQAVFNSKVILNGESIEEKNVGAMSPTSASLEYTKVKFLRKADRNDFEKRDSLLKHSENGVETNKKSIQEVTKLSASPEIVYCESPKRKVNETVKLFDKSGIVDILQKKLLTERPHVDETDVEMSVLDETESCENIGGTDNTHLSPGRTLPAVTDHSRKGETDNINLNFTSKLDEKSDKSSISNEVVNCDTKENESVPSFDPESQSRESNTNIENKKDSDNVKSTNKAQEEKRDTTEKCRVTVENSDTEVKLLRKADRNDFECDSLGSNGGATEMIETNSKDITTTIQKLETVERAVCKTPVTMVTDTKEVVSSSITTLHSSPDNTELSVQEFDTAKNSVCQPPLSEVVNVKKANSSTVTKLFSPSESMGKSIQKVSINQLSLCEPVLSKEKVTKESTTSNITTLCPPSGNSEISINTPVQQKPENMLPQQQPEEKCDQGLTESSQVSTENNSQMNVLSTQREEREKEVAIHQNEESPEQSSDNCEENDVGDSNNGVTICLNDQRYSDLSSNFGKLASSVDQEKPDYSIDEESMNFSHEQVENAHSTDEGNVSPTTNETNIGSSGVKDSMDCSNEIRQSDYSNDKAYSGISNVQKNTQCSNDQTNCECSKDLLSLFCDESFLDDPDKNITEKETDDVSITITTCGTVPEHGYSRRNAEDVTIIKSEDLTDANDGSDNSFVDNCKEDFCATPIPPLSEETNMTLQNHHSKAATVEESDKSECAESKISEEVKNSEPQEIMEESEIDKLPLKESVAADVTTCREITDEPNISEDSNHLRSINEMSSDLACGNIKSTNLGIRRPTIRVRDVSVMCVKRKSVDSPIKNMHIKREKISSEIEPTNELSCEQQIGSEDCSSKADTSEISKSHQPEDATVAVDKNKNMLRKFTAASLHEEEQVTPNFDVEKADSALPEHNELHYKSAGAENSSAQAGKRLEIIREADDTFLPFEMVCENGSEDEEEQNPSDGEREYLTSVSKQLPLSLESSNKEDLTLQHHSTPKDTVTERVTQKPTKNSTSYKTVLVGIKYNSQSSNVNTIGQGTPETLVLLPNHKRNLMQCYDAAGQAAPIIENRGSNKEDSNVSDTVVQRKAAEPTLFLSNDSDNCRQTYKSADVSAGQAATQLSINRNRSRQCHNPADKIRKQVVLKGPTLVLDKRENFRPGTAASENRTSEIEHTDIMCSPVLSLSETSQLEPPPEAGPNIAELQSHSGKIAQICFNTVRDILHELGNSGNRTATIKSLQLEIEELRWRHRQELGVIQHNSELAKEELKKHMLTRQADRINEVKRLWEAEQKKLIDEIKKKQWCSYCGKEAIFYCCWNTSYCDLVCQNKHWPYHVGSCAHGTALAVTDETTCVVSETQSSQINAKPATSLPNQPVETVLSNSSWTPPGSDLQSEALDSSGNECASNSSMSSKTLTFKGRKQRCGKCKGCKSEKCGKCPPCLKAKTHQVCRERRCLDLQPCKSKTAVDNDEQQENSNQKPTHLVVPSIPLPTINRQYGARHATYGGASRSPASRATAVQVVTSKPQPSSSIATPSTSSGIVYLTATKHPGPPSLYRLDTTKTIARPGVLSPTGAQKVNKAINALFINK